MGVTPQRQDPHPAIPDLNLRAAVDELATFNPLVAITLKDALLYQACRQGQDAAVLAFLIQGANADLYVGEVGRLTHLALQSSADHEAQAQIVGMLLDGGAHIHARDSEGRTALAVAAWLGNAPAVHILAARGADLNARDVDNRTPLHLSAMGSLLALLQYNLNLNARDNCGNTALHEKARLGIWDLASLLIASGANMHLANHTGQTPLGSLLAHGVMPQQYHLTTVEGLMRAGAALPEGWVDGVLQAGLKGELAVLFARTGHLNDLERLMASEVPPTITMELTRKLLEQAVHAGQLPVVKFLLESKGAAVHEVDSSGFSILSHAAASGRAKILQYQFKYAPRLCELVNQVPQNGNEPYSPLHFAAEGGHVEAAQVLIANGADPNLYTGDGFTALHFAAAAGNDALVRLLLDSGANAGLPVLHTSYHSGQTAADWARERGHGELAKLLNQHYTACLATAALAAPVVTPCATPNPHDASPC